MASKEYNHLVHLFKEAMSFHGVKLKKKNSCYMILHILRKLKVTENFILKTFIS